MTDVAYYDINMRDTISTRRSTLNYRKLEHKRVLRIGVTQLLLGLFIAMSGVFSLVASIPAWEVFYLTTTAPGIWVGVLAFVTGLFSVNSSRSLQRKNFMMIAFTICTTITFLAVLVMIGLVVADLVTVVKAETRFDYEIDRLKSNMGIESEEDISCLNLTVEDWLSNSYEENDVPDEEEMLDTSTIVFGPDNSTINATTTSPPTTELTTLNETFINSSFTTEDPPDDAENVKEDEIVRCIARSTFQQKLGIDCILIILGLVEVILASLSLYIIWEIGHRFKKEYGNGSAAYNGNHVELNLPGSTYNNNDYNLSNGHTVPIPKSIIQHTYIPQNDSFPDSDAFRSHLESFDCRPAEQSTT